MRRIRIKKDLACVWRITTNGQPEPLEGRNLSLMLIDPKYKRVELPFTTDGNALHFRVGHNLQTFTGVYALELWENLGETSQTVVDRRSAFELVNYTTQEDDGTPDDIAAAETDLGSGTLAIGIKGADGKDGEDGKDGSQWYSGEGEPVDSTAYHETDMYLNTANGDVYRREYVRHGQRFVLEWVLEGNIKGNPGEVPADVVKNGLNSGDVNIETNGRIHLRAGDSTIDMSEDDGILFNNVNEFGNLWEAVNKKASKTELAAVSKREADHDITGQQMWDEDTKANARQNIGASSQADMLLNRQAAHTAQQTAISAGQAAQTAQGTAQAAGQAAAAAGREAAAAQNAAASADAKAEAAKTAAQNADQKLTDLSSKVGEIKEDAEEDRRQSDTLGDATARSLDLQKPLTYCGEPFILYGAGAPSANTIPANWNEEKMGRWVGMPSFIGQMYINTSASSNVLWIAVNNTATSGWKQA